MGKNIYLIVNNSSVVQVHVYGKVWLNVISFIIPELVGEINIF